MMQRDVVIRDMVKRDMVKRDMVKRESARRVVLDGLKQVQRLHPIMSRSFTSRCTMSRRITSRFS